MPEDVFGERSGAPTESKAHAADYAAQLHGVVYMDYRVIGWAACTRRLQTSIV